LLLDAGTGLRRVSELLGDQPFLGTVLVTHLHWDHIQGVPFFDAGDRPDGAVHLRFPPDDDGTEPERLLARMMSPPFFPIGPERLRGDWRFSTLSAGSFAAEGFDVIAREVPHKGARTLGLRVSDGRSSMAYIPDHCPTAVGLGPDGLGAYHDAVLELARRVDLLVHDAHLRAEEVEAEGSFGHAAAEYAVGLGARAGAGRVALFHHRPERDDDEMDRTLCRFADGPLPVVGAQEGSTLSL
jgi:phosphoribosyl 1,2-cyclic phosphodiesterase